MMPRLISQFMRFALAGALVCWPLFHAWMHDCPAGPGHAGGTPAVADGRGSATVDQDSGACAVCTLLLNHSALLETPAAVGAVADTYALACNGPDAVECVTRLFSAAPRAPPLAAL
jgi:hypothetical protein